MARFVETFEGDGRISLETVARLEAVYDRPGGEVVAYECFDSSGEDLGAISKHEVEGLEHRLPVVIPDMTGAVLVSFAWYDDALHVTRWPVMGWRVDEDTVRPLTPESHDASNVVTCLELRTGIWSFGPEDAYCESFEEAKAHALEALQQKERVARAMAELERRTRERKSTSARARIESTEARDTNDRTRA